MKTLAHDLEVVIAACLRELRRAHPAWSAQACASALGMEDDVRLAAMIRSAGFPEPEAIPPEAAQVLLLHRYGVWSDEVIADETRVPVERVREILAVHGGYGEAAYGCSPYGGNRASSDGEQVVARRVTVVGQFSYRGNTYTLGRSYRGRTAWLIEHGPRLTASFGDRPTLHLAARHVHRQS